VKSFEKFLEVAMNKLTELEKLKTQNDQNRAFDPAIPNKEKIQEYQRKINYLKELKNTDKTILTNDEGYQQTKVIRNKYMNKEEKSVELEARTKVRDYVVSQMKKLITPDDHQDILPDQPETNPEEKEKKYTSQSASN